MGSKHTKAGRRASFRTHILGASVAARGWFAASADWRRAAAAVETLRAQIGRAVEARRDEIAGLS